MLFSNSMKVEECDATKMTSDIESGQKNYNLAFHGISGTLSRWPA